MMEKVFSWVGGKVLEIDVPGYENWLAQLIDQFESNQNQVTKSHKIKGRWENWYLDIEAVPEARNPIRFARDVGREIFKTSSVILFDSFPGLDSPHPPFWFNRAEPGESTGLHDHQHHANLSGVFYLSCELNSGNLYFHKEGEVDLEIMPRAGKLVLFEPWMPHGVRENRSHTSRLSLAFNLFPFPLPATNL